MSERILILWFGQFCEAINNYENIEIENREGVWEKYPSKKGCSLAKLELEFIGMKFSYFEKEEPAQYNATPPTNEWPCKPECGAIRHDNNGKWQIIDMNCFRLVPNFWKSCPVCLSCRPAEAQKQEEKEEPKAEWRNAGLITEPHSGSKSIGVLKDMVEFEKPIVVRVEREINKIKPIFANPDKSERLLILEKIAEISDAVNLLIQGEGVLKVKVQK